MGRRIAIAALALSCASGGQYPASVFPNVTKHAVTVTRHTPAGVAVDDPRGEMDDAVIDAAFTAVEACLASMPRTLTAGESAMYGGMFCHSATVPAALDRRSLTVKVAPDWHRSVCTGEELFPCTVDQRGCDAKGLGGVPCACECRHSIQRGNVLVVTPAAVLLRAAIVQAATGCENPWAGGLKECTH